MHKIKFGLHIGNIMIFLTLHIWGGHGAPHTPKIEILKWPSSVPAQYKFILWYKLSFLWKFQPDWPTLRGVLGWSGIFMTPSPTALPEPALWAGYEFLKEQTIKIHFRGDSCRKQYGFQPWIYLNWEYISISLYSHLWLYFRLPGPHMTHKTPLVYQM